MYKFLMKITPIEKRTEILDAVNAEFSSYWAGLHSNPPHTLWHFTDAGGLLGMLQNNQLWFTDAKFLNDYSEMSYALGVIESIINEHLENTEYSQPVSEYLSDMLTTVKSRVKSDLEVGFMNPAFVCCFCEEKDSLHLWRAYTNNGKGYSFGFFVEAIFQKMSQIKIKETAVATRQLHETWYPLNPYFCRVIYEKKQQHEIIGKLIETVVNAINANPDCFPLGHENNLQKIAALSKIYSLFYLCLFCFKDPSFAGEREWRLVYARRFGAEDNLETLPEAAIHYRVSGNYIVPYLKVNAGRKILIDEPADSPELNKLVFETIYTGPGLDYELARSTIFSYAYRNGYLGYNINVEKSKVPLRSMQ